MHLEKTASENLYPEFALCRAREESLTLSAVGFASTIGTYGLTRVAEGAQMRHCFRDRPRESLLCCGLRLPRFYFFRGVGWSRRKCFSSE